MTQSSRMKHGVAESDAGASWKIGSHAHYVRLDDQVIVADMRSGHYLGLDGAGARVWDLVGSGATRAAIIERLLAEYDVSRDALERDVMQLISELSARGLIERG